MKNLWNLLFATIGLAAAVCASAAGYSEAPIKVIVGFPPGGATDTSARIVCERLSIEIGQPMPIENKIGASGTIGAQAVAYADPNGHTVLYGSSSELLINPLTRKNPPYSLLKDFIPVTEVGRLPFVLVVPANSPYNDVQALVAQAGARSGALTYSTFGVGAFNHLATELFLSAARIRATHVPYKGSQQAITGMLGGEVDFAFESLSVVLPQIRAGRLKALATPSPARLRDLPAVPTIAESGYPDVVAEGWVGLFMPAGADADVVVRLNRAAVKVLQTPEVNTKLEDRGVRVSASAPAEFRRKLASEVEKWQRLIRETGLVLD